MLCRRLSWSRRDLFWGSCASVAGPEIPEVERSCCHCSNEDQRGNWIEFSRWSVNCYGTSCSLLCEMSSFWCVGLSLLGSAHQSTYYISLESYGLSTPISVERGNAFCCQIYGWSQHPLWSYGLRIKYWLMNTFSLLGTCMALTHIASEHLTT